MPNADRMAGWYDMFVASVAKRSSIWSIAGMTVARFGVPREKNRVASLRIYMKDDSEVCPCVHSHSVTHLKDVAQLFHNLPFVHSQGILA
jgi:hypothetical protein